MHQLSSKDCYSLSYSSLELVYIDIWGLAPVTSTSGAKYYITFLNAYSKFTWIYLLHPKSQVSSMFILLKTFDKNQTNHSDNAE